MQTTATQNQPTVINCKTATIAELEKAFHDGIPIAGIDQIGTHYGPHIDEMATGWVLQNTPQGKYFFPGIDKAAIGPISPTKLRKAGYNGIEGFFRALSKGLLLIGVGEGLFDEHRNRKEHVSCLQLIVDYLDLMRDPNDRRVYGELIRYVNFEDTNGDNALQCLNRIREKTGAARYGKEEAGVLLTLQTGALAQSVKKAFEAYGSDVEKHHDAFAMVYRFCSIVTDQARIFAKTASEYEAAEKKIWEFNLPGKPDGYALLEIKSDSPAMNKVVHNKWSQKKLGLLFLRKSNGQFALMPDPDFISVEEMKEVVKVLRQMILIKTGNNLVRFADLSKSGVINAVPEIHFNDTLGIISNGSKTDPDVEGLIGEYLKVGDVMEAIHIGLNKSYFPSDFRSGCFAGHCVKGRCPFYNFGLKRCFDIRSKEEPARKPVLKKAPQRA